MAGWAAGEHLRGPLLAADLPGELALVAEPHVSTPIPGVNEELAPVDLVPYPVLFECFKGAPRHGLGHALLHPVIGSWG